MALTPVRNSRVSKTTVGKIGGNGASTVAKLRALRQANDYQVQVQPFTGGPADKSAYFTQLQGQLLDKPLLLLSKETCDSVKDLVFN